jgi:hypothetical protein
LIRRRSRRRGEAIQEADAMTIADEARVRERAYLIWEAEGRPEGKAAEHWTRALKEIATSPPMTTPTMKAAAKTAAPSPVKTDPPKTAKVMEMSEEAPKVAAKKRTAKKS